MARAKGIVRQNDFSFMELREDFLDGDDLDARRKSLRLARNVRALASRAAEVRPGLVYAREIVDAEIIKEIRPADGLAFILLIGAARLTVLAPDMSEVHLETSVPWPDANVCVLTFRERTVIGHESAGIFVLEYDGGAWSLDPFNFDLGPGGELTQPYWVFRKGVSINPSDVSGTVTVTASEAIFTPDYVGQRIRYAQREITITVFNSPTVVTGVVVATLPPTYRVEVSNTGRFLAGQGVVGSETGFEGIITRKTSSYLYVVPQNQYDGPDPTEKIVSPTASSAILSLASVNPESTTFWDEPAMSPARGYPRSASAVSGRLLFCDFPQAPDLVALSSARSQTDFASGARDDDAIVRQVGDDSPRFRHAINAGDLVLLSDRGCYYIPARDSGLLTPATFNPVLFDRRACSEVRPVLVDDGVVFVDSTKKTLAYAVLAGDVNKRWRVRDMTTYHHQTINDPVGLCGPDANFRTAEKYLFVVNGDGTLAAVSWREELASETVGFCPWDTEGAFLSAAPALDAYHALVRRTVAGADRVFLERFDDAAWLDCAVLGDLPTPPAAAHLAGHTTALMHETDYAGSAVLGAGGEIETHQTEGAWQVGLRYTARLKPWPAEIVSSPRHGELPARVISLIVSLQNSTTFGVTVNGRTRRLGGYRFGDDLSKPVPLRTEKYQIPVLGNRDHPDLEVFKDEPGPFRVLSLDQKVQA